MENSLQPSAHWKAISTTNIIARNSNLEKDLKTAFIQVSAANLDNLDTFLNFDDQKEAIMAKVIEAEAEQAEGGERRGSAKKKKQSVSKNTATSESKPGEQSKAGNTDDDQAKKDDEKGSKKDAASGGDQAKSKDVKGSEQDQSAKEGSGSELSDDDDDDDVSLSITAPNRPQHGRRSHQSGNSLGTIEPGSAKKTNPGMLKKFMIDMYFSFTVY